MVYPSTGLTAKRLKNPFYVNSSHVHNLKVLWYNDTVSKGGP